MIALGIGLHSEIDSQLLPNTINESGLLTEQTGLIFVASLFLRAYSLGGGTYTGIEAVSDNVQSLAEPRVLTGKWTMFYMAVSLSFTAGGIILLYLLWDVRPVEGETLNAVTFVPFWRMPSTTPQWNSRRFGPSWRSKAAFCLWPPIPDTSVARPCSLIWQPNSWVPHQYRYLSSRLVTQRGIVLMGFAAIGICW